MVMRVKERVVFVPISGCCYYGKDAQCSGDNADNNNAGLRLTQRKRLRSDMLLVLPPTFPYGILFEA